MIFRTDWDCRLLSCFDPDSQDPNQSPAIQSILHLHESGKINRFCMMPLYDFPKEPVSVFLLKRQAYSRSLSAILPKDIPIKYAARVLLRPALSKQTDIKELTIGKGGYLPLLLPICEYQDWIDVELNQLLYKRKLPLLLMSCELFPVLYPMDIAEKLFRIQNAAYQFGYKSLHDPKIRRLIYNLLKQNKTILFGSGVESLHQAWNLHPDACACSACKWIPDTVLERNELCANRFW